MKAWGRVTERAGGRDPTHAIAYMAWERIVPWKVLSLAARPEEPPVPVGFGSRSRRFYEKLRPASRIWVVTRIAKEPSLAGCVTVRAILDRDDIPESEWPRPVAGLLRQWRYVAVADAGRSRFFEANNAGPVLRRHRVRFAQSRTIVYRTVGIEAAFEACVEQAGRGVFLSYRWREARRFAVALARELRRRGLSPWLDALSVPAYEAKRDPGVDAPRLKKLIRLGIEASRFAVVVNTDTFATSPWTKMELAHIRRSGIPWIQVMRGGSPLRSDAPRIVSRRPEAVASEILDWRASV